MPNRETESTWWHALLLSLAAGALAVGFIGVAAWGWGGWEPLLAHPARMGVCAALVLLAVLTPLFGCNTSPGRVVQHENDWIFPALLVAGLGMGWASAYSDRRDVCTLDGNAARYLGLVMFCVGCILRFAAMRVLGARFSVWVAVQEEHRLETTGLYQVVRHPSYTGVLLTLFGWALTFRSAIGLLLAMVMMMILRSRMEAEEQLLISAFGGEYMTYRTRTWRLIPFLY